MDNTHNFEKNITELEAIISELESGNLTLDESVSLFEKGMEYAAECKQALDNAEKKIIQLSELEKGEISGDN